MADLREYPPTGIAAGSAWTKDTGDTVAPRAGATNYARYKNKVSTAVYANGWYVASADTVLFYVNGTTYGNDEWPPSGAFDKLDAASSTRQGWHANESVFTSTADASPAANLFVTIAHYIKLNTYSLKSRTDGLPEQMPTKWNLYGSINGGTSWTLIHAMTASGWTTGGTQTFTASSTTAYNAFRWEVFRNGGGAGWLHIGEIRLYGYPEPRMSRLMNDGYPSTLTTGNSFGMRPGATTRFSSMRGLNGMPTGSIRFSDFITSFNPTDNLFPSTWFRLRTPEGLYLRVDPANAQVNTTSQHIYYSTQLDTSADYNGYKKLGSMYWLKDQGTGLYLNHNGFVTWQSASPFSVNYAFRAVPVGGSSNLYHLRSPYTGDHYLGYDPGANRFRIDVEGSFNTRPFVLDTEDVPPITSGLVGLYTGESFNGSRWSDISGCNNNATSLTGTINQARALLAGNRDYIAGGTTAGLKFPAAILPSTYTLFHVAKYNGESRGRIFNGESGNWLSGFWGGLSGVSYHDGGDFQTDIAADVNNYYSEWILSSDRATRYRAQKTDHTSRSPTGFARQLTVNFSTSIAEKSDWAVACVIAYNRELTLSEILQMENWLIAKYRITFLPPILNGIVGMWTGESWNGSSWRDLSGNFNHVTTYTGTVTRNYSSTELGGHDFISGTTATTMTWPAAVLPATYTFFHLTKYNGATQRRIFTSATTGVNWLSGHGAGLSGIAFHTAWLTQSTTSLHGMDWVLSTDQNAIYRSQRVNRTTGTPGTPSYDRICINTGPYSAETSDWACAFALVYNRTLTSDEVNTVENWIALRHNRNLISLPITVPTTNEYPPVISGMVGMYTGESWNGTRWTDISGNLNHVTTVGGTITKNTGLLGGRDFLSGTTTSTLTWPTAILPATYTFFHLCRYTGGASKRIFQGMTTNWLSGFHDGRTGVAFHNAWITPYVYLHGTDWVLSTDQNSLYRSQRVDRTNASPGTPSYDRIAINVGNSPSEVSDWACAFALVYNRTLTTAEIVSVENWITARYSLATTYVSTTIDPFTNPPITYGLVGYYTGESWNGTSWQDLSGVENHVTTVSGTVTKNTAGLNGRDFIAGNTSTSLTWPAAILPATYTMFHVTKYNGATRRRIFSGFTSGNNWLSGFHGGQSGVAYHMNWLTSYDNKHGLDWVLSTDQNSMYRSNRINRTTGSPGNPTYDRIVINGGHAPGESSDWACACALVYNRTLNDSEINAVENWLANRYGLTLITDSNVPTREEPPLQNLLVWLDPVLHRVGAATVVDQSANGYNFTLSNVAACRTDGLIPHFSMEGSYSSMNRTTEVPAQTCATIVLFSSILNSSVNWRTLIRGITADHQIMVEQGSARLGMFDNNGGGFQYSGIDITSLPTPYTSFNMLVFRLGTTIPYYQFSLGCDSTTYNMTNDNAIANNGFASLGHTGSSQYWGKIGTFLYYNRWLTTLELRDIYNQYEQRYFYPHPGDTRSIDDGTWNVLYEVTNPTRDAAGNLIYTQNHSLGLLNRAHNRVAYYMQNRMNNGVMYYAFVSMDSYATDSNITAYRVPDTVDAFVNQRNTSNLRIFSNHPQVGNYTATNGRLEIWPWNYGQATTFGDGSGAVFDYDDTPTGTNFHGSFQVHDITNRKTLMAWNAHWNGTTPSVGIGNNDSTNIHYTTANSAGQDWTGAANGALGWRLQVLVNTGLGFIDRLSAASKEALVGAYSLQRLSSTYTGPTITVRRYSDSATLDFFADYGGTLGTALNGTGQNIVRWLAGDTGYITRWYDQSGKGNHAFQNTTTAQPRVDIHNVRVNFFASRYMSLPNGTIPVGNSSYTFVAMHGNIDGAIIGSGVNSPQQANVVLRVGGNYNNGWAFSTGIGATYKPESVATFKYDGSYRYIYVNGALEYTQASSSRNGSSAANFIGLNFNGASPLNGELYYLAIFNTSLSDTERAIAEAGYYTQPEVYGHLDALSGPARNSLNAAFSFRRMTDRWRGPIFTIRRGSDNATRNFYSDPWGQLGDQLNGRGQSLTAWLNGATGYVTRWFDQSGSGRDATQSDATYQPIIDITNRQLDFKTYRFFYLPDGTVPFNNSSYTLMAKHNTITPISPRHASIVTSGAYNNVTNTVNSFELLTTGSYLNYWWANDLSFSPPINAVNNVVTACYAGAGRVGFVNQVLRASDSAVNRASTSANNRIGTDVRGGSSTSVNNHWMNGELYWLLVANINLDFRDRYLAEIEIPRYRDLCLYLDARMGASYGGSGTTWSDLSGYRNDVTLTNVTYEQSTNSMVFNGSSSFAYRSSFTGLNSRQYTIIIWVNVSTSFASDQSLLGMGRSAGNTEGQINLWNSGFWDYRGGFGIYSVSLTVAPFTTKPSTIGWNQIAVVRQDDDRTAFFYLNGGANGSATSDKTIVPITQSDLCIGKDYRDNTRFLNGKVGLVFMYNYAMSPAEVYQNYVDNDWRFGSSVYSPFIWLRASDLTGVPEGTAIDKWYSATNGKVATAYGVGTTGKPVVKRTEAFPYVRLGSGAASTTNGNYFDFGSQTINISTNAGFTVIFSARFVGPAAHYERVIDFSNGQNNDNIVIARYGSTTSWASSYRNGTTTVGDITASSVTGSWQTVAVRFITNETAMFIDGTKTTGGCSTMTNKTLAQTWIGRSAWSGDSYANVDIRELLVYDRGLSDTDINNVTAYINAKFVFSPFIWLRASDLTTADGATISTWPSVTNGKTATGYGAGTSGLPVMNRTEMYPFVRLGTGTVSTTNGSYFNLGAQTMNISNNSGFTIVACVRFRSAATWERIIDFGNGENNDNIILARYSSGTQFSSAYRNGTTSTSLETGTITGGWQTVAARFISGEIAFIEGSKTTATNQTIANKSFTNTYIGRSHWSVDNYANIDIREIMIYEGGLTDSQISSVRSYMNSRFG